MEKKGKEEYHKALASLSHAKEDAIAKLKVFFAKAKDYAMHHKTIAILALCGVVILFFMFCCCCCHCCCKKKTKKKIKEKLKLKSMKPSKLLKRIQPGKRVKRIMEDVGDMTFCLKYDPLLQMLTVTVLKSNGIPIRDMSGYSYSFVSVKLLPLHEDEMKNFDTTLVRPATFYPSYGDTFSFPIARDELKKQTLILYQYERNQFSQRDGVGQVTFELKSGVSPTDTQYTHKILPFNPLLGLEKEMGAVLLSLEHDRENWQLHVEIEEADILPEDEDKEKYTSYVTISLLNKDGAVLEKQKTRKISGTLQPEFDEKLTFSLPDSLVPDAQILMKLKYRRMLKKNKVLGKCIIKSTSENWKKLMADGVLKSKWFQVFKKAID